MTVRENIGIFQTVVPFGLHPFVVDVPDVFTQAFVMEKDNKRFPKGGGWGYAVFNYEATSDQFTPDPKSLSDCGHSCHTAVKAKDYIFHPCQKR
jgi:hypothetical protein